MKYYYIDLQKMELSLDGMPRFIYLKGRFTEEEVNELDSHPEYADVDVWGHAKQVTALDEISRLIREYRIPAPILRDVQKRIGDWKSSLTYVDDSDPYLWQQVRFVENYLKKYTKQENKREVDNQ